MDKRVIESPRDCGRRRFVRLGEGCWDSKGRSIPCPDPDRFPDDCPLERLAPRKVTRDMARAIIDVLVEGAMWFRGELPEEDAAVDCVLDTLRDCGIAVEEEKK
jgi:hypothetical protein